MLIYLRKSVFSSTLLLCLTLRIFATPTVGIQQDWLEGHDSLLSFSAIMVFNAKSDGSSPVPSITDGQMVGLAAQAYQEMLTIWNAIPDKVDPKPGAIAAFAINNEIYFASVVKADRQHWLGLGQSAKPQVLMEAAGGCRIAGSVHRTDGHCAEINLMDTYYTRNKNLNFQGSRSRLVVWGTDYGILPPCSDSVSRYGCYKFLRAIANPQNPQQQLQDNDMKVIASNTARDNSFPVGLVSRNVYTRISTQEKAALCEIADDPYDPNKPELRRRMAMEIDSVMWT